KSFHDVERYLVDEFARIHQEHHETMATVPIPWPPPDIMEALVEKSSGYFVYASTVIKFIDDKNFRPTDGLKALTGMEEPADLEAPFAALDQLYSQILAGVPRRPGLLRILDVLAAGLALPIELLEHLVDVRAGDGRLIMRGLHSVFEVPQDAKQPIHVHHASFLDYLRDPQRSGVFH
ncbi:hypothetical protein C8R46DRAFT_872772, partial [Mycena filopes]